MSFFSIRQSLAKAALLAVAATLASGAAGADEPPRRTGSAYELAAPDEAPARSVWEAKVLSDGYQFACMDDNKMLLAFQDTAEGVDALIHVHGRSYRLPAAPSGSGEVKIVWSDGASSLTWSPGVKLMWMSGPTHLMCGRSHRH